MPGSKKRAYQLPSSERATKKAPPATPAQIAAQAFEPLEFDLNLALSVDQINDPHIVTFRLAGSMVCKTKAELIEAVRALGGDLPRLVERLQATQAFFKGAAALVESAELRLMVAAHAAVGPAGWGEC